jgi:hypothetical protein
MKWSERNEWPAWSVSVLTVQVLTIIRHRNTPQVSSFERKIINCKIGACSLVSWWWTWTQPLADTQTQTQWTGTYFFLSFIGVPVPVSLCLECQPANFPMHGPTTTKIQRYYTWAMH